MTERTTFRLADLLLGTVAAPIWWTAILVLGSGTGWGASNGQVVVLLVLIAITLAINRIVKRWALSAAIAPTIALLAIAAVHWIVSDG